jgi:hypothetical protein
VTVTTAAIAATVRIAVAIVSAAANAVRAGSNFKPGVINYGYS